MRSVLVVAAAFAPLCLSACPRNPAPSTVPAAPEAPMSDLVLKSTAFDSMQKMPRKYTCEGDDISPPLSWTGVPEGTRSLALIVDDPDAPDPDAPQRVWVHWVLFDIPPATTSLPEGAATGDLPQGTRTGTNDWGRSDYGGPCPPIGRHRYFHKLYALDTVLGLESPDKKTLEEAMTGHILGQTQLVGTYKKGD